MRGLLLLALCLFCFVCIPNHVAYAKLPHPVCSEGGYCSCNAPKQKITSYLDEAAELKPVLQATAFRKEVGLQLVLWPPGPLCAALFCDGAPICAMYIRTFQTRRNLLSFPLQLITTVENRPDVALQFVSRFQSAGYCHMIMNMASLEQCNKLHGYIHHVGIRINLTCGAYRNFDEDGTPIKTIRIIKSAVAGWW